jgi:hypothetical protein
MRTTLDIDQDILLAAKEIARDQGVSAGKALSDLARKGLIGPPLTWETKNGVPQLPIQPGARVVTMELVNKLRDEAP